MNIFDIIGLIFNIPFWILALPLAFVGGYLLLLTFWRMVGTSTTPLPNGGPTQRFTFLIPAHNEEHLLPTLLANLEQLEYPKRLYTINVVADNCTDQTAALARDAGAVVHERFDDAQRGKGYALAWVQERIATEEFDAAVILDADSVVSANFLTVMDAHLQSGARVVQAYYAVLESERSWAVGLRAAALAVLHYLRPQGRMFLGLSAGLKGNGMVIHRQVLEEHQWSASVTEDIDYHMSLLFGGERVLFAPDAVVQAEIPTDLGQAKTQNVRWEQGRLQTAKKYTPLLIKHALPLGSGYQENNQKKNSQKERSQRENGQPASAAVLLDAAMEHLIPPFSIVAVLSLLLVVMAILFGDVAKISLASFILLSQIIYLGSGMVLAGLPRHVYLSLLYLPFFLLWKSWLYIRVLLKLDNQGWFEHNALEKIHKYQLNSGYECR